MLPRLAAHSDSVHVVVAVVATEPSGEGALPLHNNNNNNSNQPSPPPTTTERAVRRCGGGGNDDCCQYYGVSRVWSNNKSEP